MGRSRSSGSPGLAPRAGAQDPLGELVEATERRR